MSMFRSYLFYDDYEVHSQFFFLKYLKITCLRKDLFEKWYFEMVCFTTFQFYNHKKNIGDTEK